MKLPTPVTEDRALSARLDLYEKAGAQALPWPAPDPIANPVPGVTYDSSGFPMLPDDVTALNSQDLGRLFYACQIWHSYVSDRATEAAISEREQKAKLALVKAHVRVDIRTRSAATKDDVDDRYRIDARFIDAETRYLVARAKAELIEAGLSTISKRFTMLSREISRRTGDFAIDTMNPDLRAERRYRELEDEHNKEKKPGISGVRL
jgi:hypothetical protein